MEFVNKLIPGRELSRVEGRYTLIDGEYGNEIGGMRRVIAKKVSSEDFVADDGEVRRIKDSCPHFMKVSAVHRVNDDVYLVMDWCNYTIEDLLSSRYNCKSLWNNSLTFPSPLMIKMIGHVVEALGYLHAEGVYCNVDPRSIYVVDRKRWDVKISDFGSSRGIQSDMRSLGLLIYFCLVNTRDLSAPDRSEMAIKRGEEVALARLDYIPEAKHLVGMLITEGGNRMSTKHVLDHPFFWTPEKRFAFFVFADSWLKTPTLQSDFVNHCASDEYYGYGKCWKDRVHDEIHDDSESEYSSEADGLIRCISHTMLHPMDFESMLGGSIEEVDWYYYKRFPTFLMHVYRFMSEKADDELKIGKFKV